jgi:hypothetical protein
MLSDIDAACVVIALALCLSMLIDTDASCVVIALALCLSMLSDMMLLLWPLL